ncbi:MAG: hypothetical protein APF80_09020 [Alphaproteobacteria bacterium BRH_c36]|nr:MAG: hypothetical protein APF80_09020 [Alphaproteobacteria bacterium BRH_c36]
MRTTAGISTAKLGVILGLLIVMITGGSGSGIAADEEWESLRADFFGDRKVDAATNGYKLFVDNSVKDAAMIPVSIRIPSALVDVTSKVHLLVDNNPAPLVAVISFGPAYRNGVDIGERNFDTRIRMDRLSKVRAVFETVDGKLFMAAGFAATGGGCSSASAKDAEKALAQLGRVKVKIASQPNIGPAWRDAIVMIRHPNFTGMQPDAKMGGFTPAWFVEKIDVSLSGEAVFSISGGISLSEDPNFRFTFADERENGVLAVTAIDSKGKQFSGLGGPSS